MMDRCTFNMDSRCTLNRCIFMIDALMMNRCTFMMDKCTFIIDRCTFMMDRCTVMMEDAL